jgi:hypothetical protein
MKRISDRHISLEGFSLAEVLVALMIGAMVLVAVLSIYSRAESIAGSITRRFDDSRLPFEILQFIAEDVDRVLAGGADTKITINNKFEKGYPIARLEILKSIYGIGNKKQTFEKIVWQSSYDGDTDSLVLYRSHSGINSEDGLLDKQKEDWEKELFVPICSGITLFRIQVPSGEDFLDSWTDETLPRGMLITISFAMPVKTVAGTFDVPDSDKVTRMIAVDRTRKIDFTIVKSEEKEPNLPAKQAPGPEQEGNEP